MTTFNTGNPIGSTDARDLSDNAKNFDEFSNSTETTFTDRFGVARKTLPSLISKAEQDIYYAVINAWFQPASFDFVTGGTLVGGERNKAVFNPSPTGDDNWYAWQGALPKTISPNSTPAASGGLGENAWKPVTNSVLAPTVRESIRRSYAEAGYNLVDGSFEAGGTLVNANDVLLQERTGKAFSGPAGTVAAGTDPTLPSSGYVPRTDVVLRVELKTTPGSIAALPSMSTVPAHSDAGFDTQAQTLADRDEYLRHITAGGSKSFAEVTYQANPAIGGALTVACYGDSLTYGYDTQSTTGDLRPSINGATDTRALYQYPESLGVALTKAGFTVTIENRGYPGDTTTDGLTRWASASATNIAILMYGTNDSLPVSGLPKVSMAQYKMNMITMIRREQDKGAFVILMSPPRLRQPNLSGIVQQRQQWMRNQESVLGQLSAHFGIPLISADEIVRHRVADCYSDDTHLNKYGYNLLGWNAASQIIQKSTEPTRLAAGSMMTAAGGSMTGIQSLLDGTTVMVATASSPIVVSGYFEEAVVAVVRLKYNSTLGGSQRVKVLLNGGDRGSAVPRVKIAMSSSAAYATAFSEVIQKGLRVFTIEVSGSTTAAYIDRIEFIPVTATAIRDSLAGQIKASKLTGLFMPAGTDVNRLLFDEGTQITGDFRAYFSLNFQPTTGQNGGACLLRNVGLTTGAPDTFISVLRLADNRALIRVVDPAITDVTTPGAVFSGASSVIEIERYGSTYTIYADGVSVHSFVKDGVGDLNLGVMRSNCEFQCNYIGQKW